MDQVHDFYLGSDMKFLSRSILWLETWTIRCSCPIDWDLSRVLPLLELPCSNGQVLSIYSGPKKAVVEGASM